MGSEPLCVQLLPLRGLTEGKSKGRQLTTNHQKYNLSRLRQ